jgi:uncharacterized membrane protein HdeD (DUF308 family)
MNTLTPSPAALVLGNEIETLRGHRLWFLIIGIAMVAVGTFAIGWACIATVTVTATWLFGFLLLGSGIAEIVHSFWVGRWSGMLVHLLVGVLYTLVGFLVIDQPAEAAVQVTLLIAIFLMVGGIFRIVLSVSERFTGWGWVLLNGAVTFMLGLMIYKQWPASSLWVIGLFIGIDLIFNGWAWIGLWLGLRRLPANAAAA